MFEVAVVCGLQWTPARFRKKEPKTLLMESATAVLVINLLVVPVGTSCAPLRWNGMDRDEMGWDGRRRRLCMHVPCRLRNAGL